MPRENTRPGFVKFDGLKKDAKRTRRFLCAVAKNDRAAMEQIVKEVLLADGLIGQYTPGESDGTNATDYFKDQNPERKFDGDYSWNEDAVWMPENLSDEAFIAKFIYFKESGKYYSGGEMMIDPKTPEWEGCIYPKDYGKRARNLKKLPGLASGDWSDVFSIETNYTELVLSTY